jgi:membrane fusion protein, copper/silver efflux system
MKRYKKGSLLKITTVVFALVICSVFFYKYGYRIPVLKEIPFFSTGHEHQYKPVINEEGEIDYWTCTMHPSVRLKEPGTCPVCGMDLVPVSKRGSNQTETETKKKTEGMQEMEGMSGMDTGSGKLSKESTFTVNPKRQQIIGVKTEPIKERQMTKVIRTVGTVELDETKVEHIHTKISGWIDKVYVDYTFKHVNKGDPLFSIYSPELVSTQEEYLLALKSKNMLSNSEFPDISKGANSLADATRRRLKLWDISENQIRELEMTGKVKKSLVINSPISGHVTFKNAFENMYLEPNTLVYTIADHTTVWINADIYENEIHLVKLGQDASITVDSLPGEVFKGKATFIWPHLMAKTRTSKVRFEFENPELKLLPEMYANLNIEIPLGKKLTIPTSAVLRTGKQDVIIVDKGEGNMEIRKIELGQKSEGFYEILRGVKEGESVVSRANFLIDSESKVQAAIATWQDESEQEDTQDINKTNNKKNQNSNFGTHKGH